MGGQDFHLKEIKKEELFSSFFVEIFGEVKIHSYIYEKLKMI